MCFPKVGMEGHKCISDLEEAKCPVCFENIKHSTKSVIPFGNCGH